MAAWPSGLRRQLQALVRKGASSNLAAVTFSVSAHAPCCLFLDYKKRGSGPVAQWIRHRSTEPEIVGSSPTRVSFAYAVNMLRSVIHFARAKIL